MMIAMVLLVAGALYLVYGKIRWLDDPDVYRYQDREAHPFHNRYQAQDPWRPSTHATLTTMAADRAAVCEEIGHDWFTNKESGQIECRRCPAFVSRQFDYGACTVHSDRSQRPQ